MSVADKGIKNTEMKRELSSLRRSFGEKISLIENLLNQARQEVVMSEQRNEMAALIAVMLRSLFCKDRSGIPLITSAQLEDNFIFPFRNSMEVYNELRGTMLVEYRINKDLCTFSASSMSPDQVPVNYLSFYSWINEVAIDFKEEGYPPLSREEVIKTIADKNGAHYDVNLDKYSACLEKGQVLFLEVVMDGQKCLFDGRNLLTETVISIADEVVFSYKYLRRPELTSPKISDRELRIFDYTCGNRSKFKYSICSSEINKYNTNKFYPCSITSHPFTTYNLVFRKRLFIVGVVRVEEFIKN